MDRRLQSVFAVLAGVLVVGAGALGAAFMQPGVNSLDDAAGQYVERGEGQVAAGAGLLVGAAAVYTYENYIKNEPKTEELQQADALETKKEIYDQASIQKQNNELTQTAYTNYLNDTESIALLEGKNAYIRALENGSSESVARNRAIDAVADYYAVKQQNLIAAYNVSAAVTDSAQYTATNTTDVSSSFVNAGGTLSWDAQAPIGTEFTINRTVDATLVNASVVPVDAVVVGNQNLGEEDFRTAPQGDGVFAYGPQHASQQAIDGKTLTFGGAFVDAPDSNYDQLRIWNQDTYHEKWTQIEAQNDAVQAQLDTFINNTYDSYQQGEINTSDLVDPYLGAREYGPENASEFQTWSLQTLSALGVNPPENLSNIGRMNVSSGGVTYTGILMSDENPAGGFTVGQTYNASELNGSQFVALDDGDLHKLEGNFTLASAETAQGETIATNETVEYRSINYETTNTSEFKALQEDLDTLTAEINARQQTLRNSGGTGFLPGIGSIGMPGAVGLLLAAGAAVFVLGRD